MKQEENKVAKPGIDIVSKPEVRQKKKLLINKTEL
jgi:hypothetical protein